MNTIRHTVRHRLARSGGRDDGGFALIFVLFVTTMIMIGTATMLVTTSGAIMPAKRSQDTAAAIAAAQAGVQAYVANLNANCPPNRVAQCSWLQSQGATPITATIGVERYSTMALNGTSGYLSSGNSGTLRLSSTGTSPAGSTDSVSRTLIVDVSGKPSPLRYAYFSNYETLGKSFLDSYYGPRKITILDAATAGAVGLTAGSTVTWTGAGAARTDLMTDNICNDLWYDDPSNPSGGSGRATLKAALPNLPTGTDYAESGTTANALGASPAAVTRYAPCELTFTKGMNLTGPVYSRDAFYLSNGEYGSTTGPSFTVPSAESLPAVSTGWRTDATPAASASAPYRSYPILGGAPTAGSGTIATSPFAGLSLPSTVNVVGASCTYYGPTKITLSGGTATITSPSTTAASGACYTSTGAGTGVVAAQVPVGTTTIYVKDKTGSTPGAAVNLTALGLSLGVSTDLTPYSSTRGDAYVSGTLTSGRLSIVTDDDIIATGDIRTRSASAPTATSPPSTVDPKTGENAWSSGSAAIDLVATNDVRVYHPVACKVGVPTYGASASLTPQADGQNGYCTNDASGLYSTSQGRVAVNNDGSLKSIHPSLQYTNLASNQTGCDNVATPCTREIDAAVFALNGSFYTDNFDRGVTTGTLVVNGGVYENHHGANGEQWSIPNSTSTRSNSGYKLQINYLSYLNAGLGYVPELSGGDALHPWQILSVSSGGA